MIPSDIGNSHRSKTRAPSPIHPCPQHTDIPAPTLGNQRGLPCSELATVGCRRTSRTRALASQPRSSNSSRSDAPAIFIFIFFLYSGGPVSTQLQRRSAAQRIAASLRPPPVIGPPESLPVLVTSTDRWESIHVRPGKYPPPPPRRVSLEVTSPRYSIRP